MGIIGIKQGARFSLGITNLIVGLFGIALGLGGIIIRSINGATAWPSFATSFIIIIISCYCLFTARMFLRKKNIS